MSDPTHVGVYFCRNLRDARPKNNKMAPHSASYLDYYVEQRQTLWITVDTFKKTFDSFEGELGLRDVAPDHPHARRDIREWSRIDLESDLQLKYFDADLLSTILQVARN